MRDYIKGVTSNGIQFQHVNINYDNIDIDKEVKDFENCLKVNKIRHDMEKIQLQALDKIAQEEKLKQIIIDSKIQEVTHHLNWYPKLLYRIGCFIRYDNYWKYKKIVEKVLKENISLTYFKGKNYFRLEVKSKDWMKSFGNNYIEYYDFNGENISYKLLGDGIIDKHYNYKGD